MPLSPTSQSPDTLFSSRHWRKCPLKGDYVTISHIWGDASAQILGTNLEWIVPILRSPEKVKVLEEIFGECGGSENVWLDIKDVPQKDQDGNPVDNNGLHTVILKAGEIFYKAIKTVVVLEYDPMPEIISLISKGDTRIALSKWFSQPYHQRVWTLQEDCLSKTKEYRCRQSNSDSYTLYTRYSCSLLFYVVVV
jgi:hypothetical protein